MNFITAMKTVLITRATDFNGRSDRPEFWWFTLYLTIVIGLFVAVDNYVIGFTFWSFLEPFGELNESGILVLLLFVTTFFQTLSLTARRLHDRGRSGWWQLLIPVPFLGLIPLYWVVRDAKDTSSALEYKNPYGSR